ncbi:MAG: Tat pathway signal protein, partial [Erythrobacter sp.]|nr:Tat pathway signal protein [Erythrobacter sp.]
MHIGRNLDLSRRAFLQRSSQLAAMGAASSYALGLAGIGEAAAFSSDGGYKALVCVFLYGGNDHGNTLIPFDAANYARYAAIRGGMGEEGGGVALPRSSLSGTVLMPAGGQTLTDDITYA